METAITQNETKASKSNTYTVRVPYAPGIGFSAALGDLVVCGECTDEITGKTPYTASEVLLKHKPMAFQVSACSNNTAFPFGKHYRLGG